MRALGFDVKKIEVQKILRDYDRNGDGLISERDFTEVGLTFLVAGAYQIVTEKMLERNPIEEMLKAFKLFDDDGTGKISLRNLRRVARSHRDCLLVLMIITGSSERRCPKTNSKP